MHLCLPKLLINFDITVSHSYLQVSSLDFSKISPMLLAVGLANGDVRASSVCLLYCDILYDSLSPILLYCFGPFRVFPDVI